MTIWYQTMFSEWLPWEILVVKCKCWNTCSPNIILYSHICPVQCSTETCREITNQNVNISIHLNIYIYIFHPIIHIGDWAFERWKWGGMTPAHPTSTPHHPWPTPPFQSVIGMTSKNWSKSYKMIDIHPHTQWPLKIGPNDEPSKDFISGLLPAVTLIERGRGINLNLKLPILWKTLP